MSITPYFAGETKNLVSDDGKFDYGIFSLDFIGNVSIHKNEMNITLIIVFLFA